MKNQHATSSTGAKKRAANALRICVGLFVTDKNMSVARRVWQLFSRFTWELPQTLIGWLYAELRNMAGAVDKVDFIGGATYVINEHWKRGGSQGVSLGNIINIDRHGMILHEGEKGTFKDFVTSNHLFMHEYGHYMQSQRWGILYLFSMGIPSLTNCIYDRIHRTDTHDTYYTETSANRNAKRYFCKNYGTEWNEKLFPLNKV